MPASWQDRLLPRGVSRGPAGADDVLLPIRAFAAGKAARARRSAPSVAEEVR